MKKSQDKIDNESNRSFTMDSPDAFAWDLPNRIKEIVQFAKSPDALIQRMIKLITLLLDIKEMVPACERVS